MDARTGKTVESFGDKGKVNLNLGLRDDPEKIADLLRSGKVYQTPIGEISFQQNGDLKSFPFAVYVMNKDGKVLAP